MNTYDLRNDHIRFIPQEQLFALADLVDAVQATHPEALASQFDREADWHSSPSEQAICHESADQQRAVAEALRKVDEA